MKNTSSALLSDGPISLLHRIARANTERDELDQRASVTLHYASSKSWQGIPSQIVQTRDGDYVVMSFREKKQVVLLPLSPLAALEIEDPIGLENFFSKPWLNDVRFVSISKLKALREIEVICQELGQKFQVQFDSFTETDDTPGALLAWVYACVAEIKKIASESMGKEALAAVRTIEIKFSSGAMSCSKIPNGLSFKLDLSAENFAPKAIFECLNSCL